jgi:hypothetical protein
MKYYNNELELREKSDDDAKIIGTLHEVGGSINQSIHLLEESKL